MALGLRKTRFMGLPCREKSLTISLAMWIQYMKVTDRQTDEQTHGHRSTTKIALSITMRSKNSRSPSVASCTIATRKSQKTITRQNAIWRLIRIWHAGILMHLPQHCWRLLQNENVLSASVVTTKRHYRNSIIIKNSIIIINASKSCL